MNELSNTTASPVDLTEASLEDLCRQMRATSASPVVTKPRLIVPPWVVKEIEDQFGTPATQAKYHQWNMRRLSMGPSEYWNIVGAEAFAEAMGGST